MEKYWENRMILIPKKDEIITPGDMRPISLLNTTYKLLAHCLTDVFMKWLIENKIISHVQKGFILSDGVFEHNYVLGSRMRQAWDGLEN